MKPCFTPPRCVTEWVSADTLMTWVREEVSACDHSGAFVPGAQKELISVLAFASVTDLFDPEEIHRNCFVQPELRTLVDGVAFFPEDLVRLLHTHRKLLERIITCLLARAMKAHYGLGSIAIPAEALARLESDAIRRLDTAHLMETS